MRTLVVLTGVVLLAHAVVLGGMPSGLALFAGKPDAAKATNPPASFVTRSIPPRRTEEPAQRVAPPSNTVATKAAPVAAAVVAIATPSDSPPTASDVTTAAQLAAPTQLGDQEAPAVLPTHPEVLAEVPSEILAQAPRQPAPVAEVPPAQKLDFAPPTRLLYDGKGEERGFIKYAASGELLWAPEGSKYNARLEISAWGFRVRTWTSKGNLSDAGLQPLRFGDKPRGAELATHFQREKGIISFSANNPDVPLQAGAQDKLSALLQLGTMVAGDPSRYREGTRVTFQAADAHNAELWNFKVGSSESLDLPGGNAVALKLIKEPTLEFDQRIEVWLAPDLHYLPVRLRITEANGTFADLLWRKTEKPD